MHSKKREIGAWIVAMALANGLPGMAKADDEVTDADRAECLHKTERPQVGSNFEKALIRLCRLQPKVDLLRREIRDIQDEGVVAAKQAELDAILPEYREVRSQVNRGGKKYRKIVKKERRIEKLEEDIDELQASKAGKSPEEIAEINQTIDALEAKIVSKKNAVKRKEAKYEKITGDKAPSRNPSPTPSPSPSPSPIPPIGMTEAEKRKELACWTREDAPLKETVAVHFPIGSSTLVGSQEFETKVQDLFYLKTRAVADRIAQAGYKIYKVEATSHASKVPHSKTGLTPAQLAEQRSKNASAHFFTNLSIGNENGENPLDLKSLDFEGALTVPPKGEVAVGPKADISYRTLAARKFTPEQMEKALAANAKAIFAGKDPTPVRGATEAETLENLRACCDTNLATVIFQPYQFTTLTFYGSKFTPDSDACIAKSTGVANTTGVKKIDETPAETDDGNWNNMGGDEHKYGKPGSRQSVPVQ